MSLKKTVAIAAAAGALAAISVPAMAFENEFHGIFNTKFYLSNIDQGGTAIYNPSAYVDSKKTANFFEQRARLQYTAKASDDLKLVTHFELDSNYGGVLGGPAAGYRGIPSSAASTQTGQNSGALDADSITLETKHVFLEFKAGPTTVRTGIQPFADSFNGTLLIADVAAVTTSSKLGALNLGVGYARLATAAPAAAPFTRINDANTDLFYIDTKFAVSKDFNVGMPYYFLADYSQDNAVELHTLGLTADAKMGALSFNTFLATQFGHQKHMAPNGRDSANYHGLEMGYNVKMAAGPGALKTGLLFTTGDNISDSGYKGAQRTGWRQIYGSANNQTGLMLLSRNDATGGLTNTHFLAINSGNSTSSTTAGAITASEQSRGLILFNLGYDATLSPKAYANANVGMAWVAKSYGAPKDAKTGVSNSGDLMGTELNIETGYKLYDNLTVKLQAAYVLLGGYYKGSAANSTAAAVKDPDNPYTLRTGLSYTF